MLVSEAAIMAAVLGLRGQAATDPRRALWLRVRGDWTCSAQANAAAFVPPGRPAAWAREDEGFNDECAKIARADEARGLDAARRAAALGDRAGMTLVFRAARGFLKAYELPRKPSKPSGFPPHAAYAMVKAGLDALDRGPDPETGTATATGPKT